MLALSRNQILSIGLLEDDLLRPATIYPALRGTAPNGCRAPPVVPDHEAPLEKAICACMPEAINSGVSRERENPTGCAPYRDHPPEALETSTFVANNSWGKSPSSTPSGALTSWA